MNDTILFSLEEIISQEKFIKRDLQHHCFSHQVWCSAFKEKLKVMQGGLEFSQLLDVCPTIEELNRTKEKIANTTQIPSPKTVCSQRTSDSKEEKDKKNQECDEDEVMISVEELKLNHLKKFAVSEPSARSVPEPSVRSIPEPSVRSLKSSPLAFLLFKDKNITKTKMNVVENRKINMNVVEISDYESSDDVYETREFVPKPEWAETENLQQQMKMQTLVNPDKVFGQMQTSGFDIKQIFAFGANDSTFPPLTRQPSQAWTQDLLKQEEEEAYKSNMGFRTPPGFKIPQNWKA